MDHDVDDERKADGDLLTTEHFSSLFRDFVRLRHLN